MQYSAAWKKRFLHFSFQDAQKHSFRSHSSLVLSNGYSSRHSDSFFPPQWQKWAFPATCYICTQSTGTHPGNTLKILFITTIKDKILSNCYLLTGTTKPHFRSGCWGRDVCLSDALCPEQAPFAPELQFQLYSLMSSSGIVFVFPALKHIINTLFTCTFPRKSSTTTDFAPLSFTRNAGVTGHSPTPAGTLLSTQAEVPAYLSTHFRNISEIIARNVENFGKRW